MEKGKDTEMTKLQETVRNCISKLEENKKESFIKTEVVVAILKEIKESGLEFEDVYAMGYLLLDQKYLIARLNKEDDEMWKYSDLKSAWSDFPHYRNMF